MTPNWSRKFDDPIIIPSRGPRGKPRELVTLKDAGEYIAKLHDLQLINRLLLRQLKSLRRFEKLICDLLG